MRKHDGILEVPQTECSRIAKPKRWLYEIRVGARSAAGSMTALSLTPNVREHRFQMHHYLLRARGPA
ncbi:hypothetical protein R69888_00221 [Paraburkholderia haematera]|uniref:Uncharacterized protein n=1 Tax=Paraburkholderia haematera TaxID=2793077 RepID=A0ABN7KFK2_9BURK|nr:hypothetical protein R69888_00221 [Paraburkholderia haematera]